MKQLSRENMLLLCVMFMSSVATFSYFPYVTTTLVDYLGLTNLGMASIVAVGVLVGNGMAYVASMTILPHSLLPRLKLAFMLPAVSILMVVAAKFSVGSLALAIVAASILVYRFALGLASNTLRALQIGYLPDLEQKSRLFSYIKFSSSAGGALGPILGFYAIKFDGFPGVMKLSGLLFVCAVLILYAIKRPHALMDVPLEKRLGLWTTLRQQPFSVYLVSMAATVHYIFEAQIYTAIPITIQHHNADYVQLISLLFTANSIFLVLLIVPILSLVNRRTEKYRVLAFGSCMSMIAISMSMFIHSPLATVLVALLFTIGEIITPQLMIDMVTDIDPDKNVVGALATFNFLTAGVGLSLGYWVGGFISTVLNFYTVLAAWAGVYCIFLVLIFFCQRIPRHFPQGAPNATAS